MALGCPGGFGIHSGRMIEVEGLTKLYGDFAAVTGLSFAVRPGELLGLFGPNGAGKTTSLRCMAARMAVPC